MHKRCLLKLGDPYENDIVKKNSKSAAFRVAWAECLLLVEYIQLQQQQKPKHCPKALSSLTAKLQKEIATDFRPDAPLVSPAIDELRNNASNIGLKLRKCSVQSSSNQAKTHSKSSLGTFVSYYSYGFHIYRRDLRHGDSYGLCLGIIFADNWNFSIENERYRHQNKHGIINRKTRPHQSMLQIKVSCPTPYHNYSAFI